MHIGNDTDKSKSEAMFFPPGDLSPDHDLLVGTTFPVYHGHIHYTDSFRYLGSIITPSLQDNTIVTAHIAKATAQLGAMKDVFHHHSIDLPTKRCLYMSIQIGTVLWGCKSWSITADTQRRLEVFHHQLVRSQRKQTIKFSGVGAHHQNGIAERAIRTISESTMTWQAHL